MSPLPLAYCKCSIYCNSHNTTKIKGKQDESNLVQNIEFILNPVFLGTFYTISYFFIFLEDH